MKSHSSYQHSEYILYVHNKHAREETSACQKDGIVKLNKELIQNYPRHYLQSWINNAERTLNKLNANIFSHCSQTLYFNITHSRICILHSPLQEL